MTDVVIAPNEADARAAEAVEHHHAQMSGALATLTETLVAASVGADGRAAGVARKRLVEWCERDLLPHARAEEETLYPVARAIDEGRLLVDAMLAEHELIGVLVGQLRDARDPVRAATAATALRTVFDSHLGKENDQVLPLLLRTPGVSVADLLGGMHELLGEAGGGAEPAHGHDHSCGCSAHDTDEHPELDARVIPHAIRHATVFGALETVEPGAGLVLVAPHDPLPLLAQVGDRWPGRFRIDYLERGPEAWRLLFSRE